MFPPLHPLDLIAMGAFLGQPCVETQVRAIILLSGESQIFTVCHRDGVIERILDPGGYRLPRHTEQYSEVAEAFNIDRDRAKSFASRV